ncbi:hypothetical protein [Sinorhizobium fredii]|uniref:hypothetical protein n=1 Tax=Rhizobium fredii TaxID=380 RepID=UPI0009B6A5D6|nr:hypothetical protein [Sinorhizobium fredii]
MDRPLAFKNENAVGLQFSYEVSDNFRGLAVGWQKQESAEVNLWFEAGDPVALDADIGDRSIGQRAPLSGRTHLSPFWYGIIKALG